MTPLNKKDKNKLDLLWKKFLDSDRFKSKDAESFQLFIAENDSRLSKKLAESDNTESLEENLDSELEDKQKGYQFNSPFSNDWMILYNNNPIVYQEMLGLIPGFSKNNVEYVDKKFEEYFTKLLSVSKKQNINDELNESKVYIKNYFVRSIYLRIWTDKEFSILEELDEQNKAEFFQRKLFSYIQEMFFFAGITFSVLDGNLEELKLLIEKQKGAIETYEKLIKDKQEQQRKKIDNMAQSYIIACESYKTDKPTNRMLNELSTISIDIWKKQLTNSAFLFVLLEEIGKKKRLAKDEKKIRFWTDVFININSKLGRSLKDKKVKKIGYSDNYKYQEKEDDSESEQEEL